MRNIASSPKKTHFSQEYLIMIANIFLIEMYFL